MLKEDTAKRKQIFKEIGFGFKSIYIRKHKVMTLAKSSRINHLPPVIAL